MIVLKLTASADVLYHFIYTVDLLFRMANMRVNSALLAIGRSKERHAVVAGQKNSWPSPRRGAHMRILTPQEKAIMACASNYY